uniref:NADH dehydrogenase subunit 6 n=1 Tax=Apocryptodon punctatus TaxID=1490860 RepID=A0A172E640_9GOBI|nr:NADH dehydrogenase subunit 6 [Apocryptodon punctatus]
MVYIMYVFMSGLVVGVALVATNPSTYFGAVGLVVVSGMGCGVLVGHGALVWLWYCFSFTSVGCWLFLLILQLLQLILFLTLSGVGQLLGMQQVMLKLYYQGQVFFEMVGLGDFEQQLMKGQSYLYYGQMLEGLPSCILLGVYYYFSVLEYFFNLVCGVEVCRWPSRGALRAV